MSVSWASSSTDNMSGTSARGRQSRKGVNRTLNTTDSSLANKSMDESILRSHVMGIGTEPDATLNPRKGRIKSKKLAAENMNMDVNSVTRSRTRSESRLANTSTITSPHQSVPQQSLEMPTGKEINSSKAQKASSRAAGSAAKPPRSRTTKSQKKSSNKTMMTISAEASGQTQLPTVVHKDSISSNTVEGMSGVEPSENDFRSTTAFVSQNRGSAVSNPLSGPEISYNSPTVIENTQSTSVIFESVLPSSGVNVGQNVSHNPRKRRSSFGCPEESPLQETTRANFANPLKSILRHPSSGQMETHENDIGTRTGTISPQSGQTSKIRRINFKNDHDTRYFERAKSRRKSGDDLRIKILKKNATFQLKSHSGTSVLNHTGFGSDSVFQPTETANSITHSSSYKSTSSVELVPEHSLPPNRCNMGAIGSESILPVFSLAHDETVDTGRIVERPTSSKRATHGTDARSKRNPLQPIEDINLLSQRNTSFSTKNSSINFDSLTVINSLIDYIGRDVRGQVVEMILSKDQVKRIFWEKMVKSKDFCKSLTRTLSTHPEQIDVDELTCELLSVIVNQTSTSRSSMEMPHPDIPGCVWRKGLDLLKEAVTGEFHSPDSYHLLICQPCNLGPIDACGSHQRPNTNALNTSTSSPMFDLQKQLLQRVATKIIESYPDSIDKLNIQFRSQIGILDSFRNVNAYLKKIASESVRVVNMNDEVRKEADITFESLFQLFSERIRLSTPDRDPD